MKNRLVNNLGLKIIALLFSVFLWIAVVNISKPIETKRFYPEVAVLHSEVVTNQGKSYKVVDNVKNVAITVKAERDILEKMKTGDIEATADLRELQGAFVPIRVKINGFEGNYQEAYANPRNLQIETEDTGTKTFPVTPVATGKLQQGYILGELSAEPKSIDISGPMSSVGRISKVVAQVDVSELSENTTMTAELIYYDSADNIIDKSLLSSNVDRKGLDVHVHVLETKQVELFFDTNEIHASEGYAFAGLEVEPKYITVAGEKEALDNMKYIEVGSDVLKQENLKKNTEVVVDITKHLPEGINLVDTDARSVVVNINVEKAGVKSIMIPVRSVKINNAPQNLELSYGPEQEVELQFKGLDEVLQTMSIEKIAALVDLKDYKTEGTFDVPIKIASLPEGCTFVEGASIQIILKKK